MFVMSITTKACQSCITSVCFGIAKLWCFGLHNCVFLFSLICPCILCLKEKYAKKNKSKKNQNAFNMVASLFLGDVRVIRCISKVIVSIKQLWLCVSVFDFLMSQIFIIWDTYALLLCFTNNAQFFCYSWYMCRYNMIWSSQKIHVLIYACYTVLTCFWKIKLVKLV